MPSTRQNKMQIVFGDTWISIDDVMQIANDKVPVKLNETKKFTNKIHKGQNTVTRQRADPYWAQTSLF